MSVDLTQLAGFELDAQALEAVKDDPEVQAALREFEREVTFNPLWSYFPTDKQAVYHSIDTRIGAFVGGNQSGKTYGGCADDVIQLVDEDVLPPHLRRYKRFEEFHCRVVVPGQAESLEVVLPYFRKLIPRGQLWGGTWEKAYDKRIRKLQLANGNFCDFLSHDQNVDRFAGVQRHRIRFDEEPPGSKGREIFKECLARVLAVHGGELRFTMTPLFGLGWTYHLLTLDGDLRWDDECRAVQVSMHDNPHQDDDAREFVLGQYSDTERQAREHGRFIHMAGLVYPQFSRERHMVPDGEIPRDSDGRPLWDFYECIDPGYGHPMGFCIVAFDETGLARVVRSWKMPGQTVAMCAARILRDREELAYKPKRTLIDPSARNKHHATGRSTQMEYTDEGIYTVPAQNSRPAGINRLATWLERDRLEIWASNDELREEFETHRWKPRTGEEEGEPQVIKTNDDILDPLRYILMDRPHPAQRDAERPPLSERARLLAEDIRRRTRPKGRGNWGAPVLPR